MIRISQVKLPVGHSREALLKKTAQSLRCSVSDIVSFSIRKRSLDARKKPDLYYVYTVDVAVKEEKKLLKAAKSNFITKAEEVFYQIPPKGTEKLAHRPVVIGCGPAGLFCAYLLAREGYCPIVLERGKKIQDRKKDVAAFWKGEALCGNSNIQFGEGGAGTFSDGKLNTLVKDPKGRNKMVLDTFLSCGAPEEIGYEAKPHIGTDALETVITNLRHKIEALGGTFYFEHQVVGFSMDRGSLKQVVVKTPAGEETFFCEVAVLAMGHSARDTFALLEREGFDLEAKAFAVGLRVEHPQKEMDEVQYGTANVDTLPAASYKLATNLENKRGVYSFCMCPGGFVVNASSMEGGLAVNGMSYHNRAGKNANSAIVVSVSPADFPGEGPLAGIAFQESLERKAYEMGGGKIPQQLLGDFAEKRISQGYGAFESQTKGECTFAPLHELFSTEIYESFLAGMQEFGKKIPGFDRWDCILSGVESRTSSPVRIPRGEDFQSTKQGIYPCGEGAGYAGGIMSAAMDGLKVAEAIISQYAPGAEPLSSQ